jgi:hypothetical protein
VITGRQQYEAARKQKALEVLAELGFDNSDKIRTLLSDHLMSFSALEKS